MKPKKIISILVIVLLAVFGYFYFVREDSPEEVLMRAGRNMLDLDSYSLDITVDTDMINSEGESLGSTLISGQMDISEVEKAGEGSLSAEMSAEGTVFLAEGSFIYVDDDFYGRIDTLPLPVTGLLGDDVAGNWILVAENVPETLNQFLADLAEEDEEVKTVAEIMAELEELEREIWERELFTVREVESVELRERSVDRYEVEFDVDNLMEVYEVLFSELGILEEFEEFDDEDMEMIREEMERAYEDMEFFIYTDGEYILRVRMESVTDMAAQWQDLEEMEEFIDQMPAETVVSTIVDYDNFNQEFEINAPEEFVLLRDLVGGPNILLDPLMREFEGLEPVE